jgi:hypothetical protein
VEERITGQRNRLRTGTKGALRDRYKMAVSYLLRLAVSILGTLGFMVLLLLFLFACYKLGIHTGLRWADETAASGESPVI